jgi:hypothetical protein
MTPIPERAALLDTARAVLLAECRRRYLDRGPVTELKPATLRSAVLRQRTVAPTFEADDPAIDHAINAARAEGLALGWLTVTTGRGCRPNPIGQLTLLADQDLLDLLIRWLTCGNQSDWRVAAVFEQTSKVVRLAAATDDPDLAARMLPAAVYVLTSTNPASDGLRSPIAGKLPASESLRLLLSLHDAGTLGNVKGGAHGVFGMLDAILSRPPTAR